MRTRTDRSRLWVFSYYLRSSQRILIWCSCGKGRNFRAFTGHCKLAASINFIRGTSAGKLDSFLYFFSVGDERGSVINDYL